MRFVVMCRGDDAGRACRVADGDAFALVESGAARPLTDDEHDALNAGDRDMRFPVPSEREDEITHVGGGWYEVAAERVQGKDAALARLAALQDPSHPSPPNEDT